MNSKDKPDSALVIGAGIAGIKAALELAELGHRVYLCDRKTHIGGTLLQLDRWFPDDHCGMCKVLPIFSRDRSSQYCLRRGLVHHNIEILSATEITGVEGEAGNFAVSTATRSSGIHPDLCIGCGKCSEVCPVEVDEEFNQGLGKRKAAYLANPTALAKTYTIDAQHCTRCRACEEVCPTKAINLDMQTSENTLSVGAIILSTGFDEFDAQAASQYGYKRFPNVITSLELERLLSGSGPTRGSLLRPSDDKEPQSVAFLQCVGSRSLERNYCSSACCMYALKEAIMIKEKYPGTDVCIYFMDLRTAGKGYYRYFEKARDELGIRFVRCRVPRVMQNFKTHDVIFSALGEDGQPIQQQCDLIVLSVGQTPSAQFVQVSEMLGLQRNRWEFCRTRAFSSVESLRDGIFVCGSAAAPKDIADTLTEASAAAGNASLLLAAPGDMQGDDQQSGEQAEDMKAAVFICTCGEEITRALDTKELVSFSGQLAGVIHAGEVSHLCLPETLAQVQTKIRDMGATHVIAAGCSALTGQKLFGNLPLEIVNIREGLAWVHQDNRSAATRKARKLISMALARLRYARPSRTVQSSIVSAKGLVIGGGASGLSAALRIAEHGHQVELVERSGEVGGKLRSIHSTLEGEDSRALLDDLLKRVSENPLITVHTETVVEHISGHAGAFYAKLQGSDSEPYELDAGAVVIATGADEGTTTQYLYGQNERIITQTELEERLAAGQMDPQQLNSLVMIQCVGSMEAERPYCSRVCCAQALKNALQLKERNPDIQIYILYRELMSYGFMEEYYTRAREQGIVFIRYEPDKKPVVEAAEEKLSVSVNDPVLGGAFSLSPDLLVLSTGVVPADNSVLAGMLDIDVTEDGFFKEAEVKFRPVDVIKDGIFVCGLAHSPRNIQEALVQAQAAAERASLILSRGSLVSGQSVSEVNETWCSGCELCVQACPYGARVKDADKGVALVVEALCQGCGACVSACPNKAAKLRQFTDRQILAALDEAL